MLLMDHRTAFYAFPSLESYSCRWRQWDPGGPIDFDPGATPEDQELVQRWVDAACSI